MTLMGPWFSIVIGGLGLFLAHVVLTKLQTRRPLPPGPKADPIIGHLRKIPPVGQPELFHEWAKTYGSYNFLFIAVHLEHCNSRRRDVP